jgi:phenylpyruvate tautomerase PptA (4-oxalocrotonate tautomerase family)
MRKRFAPEQVQVFIHEVDHENWAKAGKLAADADATPPDRYRS